MRFRDKLTLGLIGILLALALMTLFWSTFNDSINRQEIKLGLDLKGGTRLVYQADFSQLPANTSHSDAISSAMSVIENRVNAYGVSEAVIQKVGDDRILVELPGIKNIEEAKSQIGQIALIKFKEQVTDDQGNVTGWKPATGTLTVTNAQGQQEQVTKELTSQYFKSVSFGLSPNTNQPLVYFNWNEDGAKLSEQITTRLLNKPLGIFLGGETEAQDQYQSSPTVNAVIKDSGVIEGMQVDEAKKLAKLLNAGRLDVPLHTIEEHDVSPTLGADFVDKSREAAIVGTLIIILFMILYYRLPGAVAGGALLIYVAMVLAVFKVWPVTLTLAGIAGFILSIGMAVDANVLIFERMREEIRWGRSIQASIETGFSRAWTAIRDSNINTMITCAVLYWLGDYLGVPAVKGFALTLGIGVVLSMFSAIIITRTFLRFVGGGQLMNNHPAFLPHIQGKMLIKGGLK